MPFTWDMCEQRDHNKPRPVESPKLDNQLRSIQFGVLFAFLALAAFVVCFVLGLVQVCIGLVHLAKGIF